MAGLFFTMAGCRGYEEHINDENRPFQPVRDLVCPHKSNILMLCGAMIFSMVFQKFYQRQMNKKKMKQNARKAKVDQALKIGICFMEEN